MLSGESSCWSVFGLQGLFCGCGVAKQLEGGPSSSAALTARCRHFFPSKSWVQLLRHTCEKRIGLLLVSWDSYLSWLFFKFPSLYSHQKVWPHVKLVGSYQKASLGSLFQSAKMMAGMNLYNHMRDIPGALMKMERKLMEQGCVSSNQLVDCQLWRVVSLFWWPLEFYGFIVEDCEQNPFNQRFLCEGRNFIFLCSQREKSYFQVHHIGVLETFHHEY